MGQIKKLDKEGMKSRADKQNLGDSSWRCFKLADQILTDIDGILSNCKVEGVAVPRYESLADSIGKLEEDCKKLLDYPEDLIEELDAVDTTFDNNVNNALNALSAIKLDDIKVKNTFDVTITQHFDRDAISMGDESVDLKKDLTLADFIGYFDGYAFGRETSFVKGFTDVLYSEDISKGKTLQELLKDNKESLKELLYGSEFDVKKYAPKGEYASEIAGDIPGGLYPLGKAIYGYDFFTQDRLTEQERVIEGLEGVIDLALLMLLWGKADGAVKAATDFLSLAGSNVARTGSENLCEDLGASPWTTFLISTTVGTLVFATGEAAGMKYEQFYNGQRGVFKGVDKNISFKDKVNSEEAVINKELENDFEERLISGTEGVVTGGDSTKLGKNMMESMELSSESNWPGYQAQHVIPSEMANHPVLQKMGMNLDDASNGLFLRTPAEDVSALSRHRGYHSTYNEFVRRQLDMIDTNQSVEALQKQVYDLQQDLIHLQRSGLPLYPSQGASLDLWQRSLERIH